MALALKGAGPSAVYYVVPILGGLAVWLTYVLGARVDGPITGMIAAVLFAFSPLFIFHTEPMSERAGDGLVATRVGARPLALRVGAGRRRTRCVRGRLDTTQSRAAGDGACRGRRGEQPPPAASGAVRRRLSSGMPHRRGDQRAFVRLAWRPATGRFVGSTRGTDGPRICGDMPGG